MVPFVAKALRLTKALALNRESALEDTKMTSMILFPISTTYPTAIEISEFGELFWTNPLTNLPDRYNRINILYRRCLQKMTDKELLAKAETSEGLTVDEIKRYHQLVKPQKHVYGKYGTLKRKYLEDKVLDWTVENIPEYLLGVDKQAEDMYNVLYAKLSLSPLYKRTGEFMEDYRRLTALQHAIEEEILSELIYTKEVV